LLKGTIYKSTGSWYKVKAENGEFYNCKTRGKLRKQNIKSTNPAAVGDIVEFEADIAAKTGQINNINDRKNYIIRKSSNLSKQSHIIAANVDQAIIMVSLTKPKTTSLFVDRFLVSNEAYSIPSIIIINKIDLYDNKLKKEHHQFVNIYKNAGYNCIETSVVNNTNLSKVKNIFQNKITVLAGNSGVGKSSLIKKIDPSINLRIGEISDYHKSGKHTTTFSEMFEFVFGGKIIDTPGIKGYGLINFEKEEIYHFFPEIFEEAKHCKFHNCLHVKEPGCEVRNAVKNNKISLSRYNNYLSILFDENSKYRV